LGQRHRQRSQAEELGPAVKTRVMMHAGLDDFARELQLAHQLDTDGAGGGGELDFLQQAAADQPEIMRNMNRAKALYTLPMQMRCQGSLRSSL
jgi:hypothetical protein